MARGNSTFRQRDAAALVRAVRQAGGEIERIELGPDGKIVLVMAQANGMHASCSADDLDLELQEFEARDGQG
jgi:hypothetical protein